MNMLCFIHLYTTYLNYSMVICQGILGSNRCTFRKGRGKFLLVLFVGQMPVTHNILYVPCPSSLFERQATCSETPH